MRLTEARSRELLRVHGIYAREVCDGCRKILGHLRFTRYGEPGEWCSRQCRDGVEAAAQYVATRKGGRPPKYRTQGERCKANAGYQRAFRQKGQDVRKTLPEVADSAGVKGANLGLRVG